MSYYTAEPVYGDDNDDEVASWELWHLCEDGDNDHEVNVYLDGKTTAYVMYLDGNNEYRVEIGKHDRNDPDAAIFAEAECVRQSIK